jgi:hypothetical protein
MGDLFDVLFWNKNNTLKKVNELQVIYKNTKVKVYLSV